MALTITCQTLDGTSSIPLTAPPYSITLDGINRGEVGYSEAGTTKARSQEYTTDADRLLRTMGWEQQISESSIDELNDAYADLADIICQPVWILVLNAGGATEQNKYYTCYAVASVPQFTTRMLQSRHKYEVQFEAEPFPRGEYVNLPRNEIIDPGMKFDSSGDGICDSFIAHASGTGAGSRYIDPDGYQVIEITTGGSGNEYGVAQAATFPVAAVESYAAGIEYVIEEALVNCTAEIYLVPSASATKYLLTGQTAIADAEASDLDTTGATDASMRLYVALRGNGAGTPAGKIKVRNSQYHRGETALPVGKDGGKLYYTSRLSTSPAMHEIKNLPGTAPATSILNFGQASTTPGTLHLFNGRALKTDVPIMDYSTGRLNTFIYNFLDTATCVAAGKQAQALGAKVSTAIAHGGECQIKLGAMRGKYIVLGRIISDSSSAATDTFRLNLYPSASWEGTPFSTAWINPVAVANKWYGYFNFGTLILPLGNISSWRWLATSLRPANSLGIESSGGTGTGWQLDTLVFIPVAGPRLRVTDSVGTGAQSFALDSISDSPGLYRHNQTSTGTVAIIAPGGTGSGYQGYWASGADYSAGIVSVDMSDLPTDIAFSGLTASVTFNSSSGHTHKFNMPGGGPGGAVNFSGTWTLNNLAFDFDEILDKQNVTVENDPEVYFLEPGISNQIPTVMEDKVNDANEQYGDIAQTLHIIYAPRFVE